MVLRFVFSRLTTRNIRDAQRNMRVDLKGGERLAGVADSLLHERKEEEEVFFLCICCDSRTLSKLLLQSNPAKSGINLRGILRVVPVKILSATRI